MYYYLSTIYQSLFLSLFPYELFQKHLISFFATYLCRFMFFTLHNDDESVVYSKCTELVSIFFQLKHSVNKITVTICTKSMHPPPQKSVIDDAQTETNFFSFFIGKSMWP